MFYLLNYGWEGYCRVHNLVGYEVAPFCKEYHEFALEYFDHLVNGGKFNHTIDQDGGRIIPAIMNDDSESV